MNCQKCGDNICTCAGYTSESLLDSDDFVPEVATPQETAVQTSTEVLI